MIADTQKVQYTEPPEVGSICGIVPRIANPGDTHHLPFTCTYRY
jgi:hypothetical protein